MNRHIACPLGRHAYQFSFVNTNATPFAYLCPNSWARSGARGALQRHWPVMLAHWVTALCAVVAAWCLAISPAQAQTEPCCSSHVGTGCLNQQCNDTVCQLDPFCCSLAWDDRCAVEASVLCETCRPVDTCEIPTSDLEEMTMCESAAANTCDNVPDIRALIPDLKLGGRAWSTETNRDVDWFEITLDSPQLLSIQMWTQGPIALAIMDDQCPPTTLAEGVDGCPSITQACVPAGVTRVVVRSLLFENISCQDERSRYTIQASIAPCTLTPVVNDRCDMALPVGVGDTCTDTTNATTETTWLPNSCDEGAGLAFTHDVWFSFTATASGIFQASTCVGPTFDSRLAVYCDCGGDLLACSDDTYDGVGASAEFQMTCGATALIRIGGWGSGGLITFSLNSIATVSCACPADLDGSGEIDSADVGACLLEMGSFGGPADIDGDGEVSSGDIGLILLSAGPCDS